MSILGIIFQVVLRLFAVYALLCSRVFTFWCSQNYQYFLHIPFFCVSCSRRLSLPVIWIYTLLYFLQLFLQFCFHYLCFFIYLESIFVTGMKWNLTFFPQMNGQFDKSIHTVHLFTHGIKSLSFRTKFSLVHWSIFKQSILFSWSTLVYSSANILNTAYLQLYILLSG